MLELKNLSFCVEDGGTRTEILRDISLKLSQGLMVVTGPNGGGKSTLARIVMGIEQPTSGQILFDGVDITGLDITQRAKLGIGYAFQHPPRFKGLTVHKLLSLAHGSELPVDQCCHYLTEVGLCSADYLDREVDSSLSGGEVKRIEIASLMARQLKLAIYDEPEAGIDLWSFNMLVNNFRHLRESSQSIMIISHQERIIDLADELVVIADGRVQDQGSRETMLPKLMDNLTDRCSFDNRSEMEGRRYG